jgi:glycosyltransferase involved in cell wall biosynthesis
MRAVPPAVSVLVPARDSAATLGACLASVRRQTRRDWECVVVDDGSHDDTPALLAAVAAADDRVRVVRTSGLGIVGALNAGLAVVRGAFIARLDADDVMRRTRLAEQVAALENDPGLVGVGSHVRVFPRATMRDGFRAYETWLNAIHTPADVTREAFVESPLAHPTLCLRRAVLVEAGYRDVGWPEDYDLLLRLLVHGHRLGTVARRLVAWRDGPARLTRTDPRYARERIVACKAAYLAAGFLAGGATFVLWGYGRTGRRLARALAEHGKRPTHIVEVHPGRIGNRIRGVPAIAPAALERLTRGRLVVSVAGPGPRAEIRAWLGTLGWREGVDFVCAA